MDEWEQVARQTWERYAAGEERTKAYLVEMYEALASLKNAPEVGPSVTSFLSAGAVPSEQALIEFVAANEALISLAIFLVWRMRDLEDESERIRLLAAALTMAYGASVLKGDQAKGEE